LASVVGDVGQADGQAHRVELRKLLGCLLERWPEMVGQVPVEAVAADVELSHELRNGDVLAESVVNV
jgi:hypothetical protein